MKLGNWRNKFPNRVSLLQRCCKITCVRVPDFDYTQTADLWILDRFSPVNNCRTVTAFFFLLYYTAIPRLIQPSLPFHAKTQKAHPIQTEKAMAQNEEE